MFGFFNRRGRRKALATGGVDFAGRHWSWEQMAQGVIAFGGIGSGKSKSTEPLIEACLRKGCPLLSTAVKPDEFERYEKICKRIGAMSRLVRICPGSNRNLNLLGELLDSPGGSIAHAANFVLNLSDIAQRANPGGGTNEAFWRSLEESAVMNGIRLAQMTLSNPGIPDIWDIIKTCPMDGAHAQRPEFQSSEERDKDGKPITRGTCAALLIHASKILAPGQADDLTNISSFFLNELPGVDKIRGSVVAALGGVLARFCVEPWRSALCAKKSTLTPEIIERERLVCVLDYPIMTYHTPARLFQACWLMLTQMYLMRRPASSVDVPFILARDEAAWTLSPEWDSAAHNVLRSQKAVSIAIVQCLNTLEAALGGGQKAHHEAMAFASNHMAKLWFSNNSADTSKWASSLIGQYKELSYSGGSGHRQPTGDAWDDALGCNPDIHWSTSYQPLVRPEAFAQLPVGVGILLSKAGTASSISADKHPRSRIMLDKPDGKSQEGYIDPALSLKYAMMCVYLAAGGYSHLFYSPLSPGCWSQGWDTILAVLLVYPAFVTAWPPVDELGANVAIQLWLALIVLLPIRGLINRRPGNDLSPYEIGTPLFGRIGNIVLPGAAWLYIAPHCPGIGHWIAAGWIGDRVRLSLIRARFTRQAKHAAAAMRVAEMTQLYMQRRGMK